MACHDMIFSLLATATKPTLRTLETNFSYLLRPQQASPLNTPQLNFPARTTDIGAGLIALGLTNQAMEAVMLRYSDGVTAIESAWKLEFQKTMSDLGFGQNERELAENYSRVLVRRFTQNCLDEVTRLEAGLLAEVNAAKIRAGEEVWEDLEDMEESSADDTRGRNRFTPEQDYLLRAAFHQDPRIRGIPLLKLAAATGLEAKQVKVWFQNHRSPRRNARFTPYKSSSSYPPHLTKRRTVRTVSSSSTNSMDSAIPYEGESSDFPFLLQQRRDFTNFDSSPSPASSYLGSPSPPVEETFDASQYPQWISSTPPPDLPLTTYTLPATNINNNDFFSTHSIYPPFTSPNTPPETDFSAFFSNTFFASPPPVLGSYLLPNPSPNIEQLYATSSVGFGEFDYSFLTDAVNGLGTEGTGALTLPLPSLLPMQQQQIQGRNQDDMDLGS